MNRIITLSWISGFILFTVTTSATVQPSTNLVLGVEILSNPIGPIEPLQLQLVVTNSGTEDIKECAPWAISGTTTVEFRVANATAWQALKVPFFHRYDAKMPPRGVEPLELRAGQSQAVKVAVVYDPIESYRAKRIKYYFSQPGDYYLRVTYAPARGWTIQSKEVGFRVVDYSGEDAVAYEWIKSRAIPHFIFDFGVYDGHSAFETVDEAREIIERFPRSRFAPLAKLYLAQCYALGLRRRETRNDPPDLQKAAELAQELATAADPYVRKGATALLDEIEGRRKGDANK
jgi:hypothetical protein